MCTPGAWLVAHFSVILVHGIYFLNGAQLTSWEKLGEDFIAIAFFFLIETVVNYKTIIVVFQAFSGNELGPSHHQC